ncbi:MAG: acetylglucosamine transferase, partial [Proteobacteria bacterium]|nr:acetylglucosamine transferase [Pseudomonadota bacterium]
LQYLIYNDIDIALDSFPCNGGTTSFDLLWMGVPLVSLPSDRFAGRMGASVLTALGRSEWVATSENQFAEIAAALALDPIALARNRAEQRDRMQRSALMNEAQFADNFVGAIRQAWEDIA